MRYVSVFLAAVSVVALSSGSASATPISLDFEGIGDQKDIGSFYNGGAGGDLGIKFSSTAKALVSTNDGGVGNFSNNPSGSTIAFFDFDSSSMSMNVAGGFMGSFSFAYTSLFFPGLVTIWDHPNGKGNALAVAGLNPLTSDCGGAPGTFNCWSTVVLNFTGKAKSVTWYGTGNFLGIDDVEFNKIEATSASPVPEPATVVLLGTGIAVAALRRRFATRS